jgi:hypothetical protein
MSIASRDCCIKGLLFAQGIGDYEPLHRDRRSRLDALTTGDGRPLPVHLKAQISRELDRLELLLEQIKAVEAERDHLLIRTLNLQLTWELVGQGAGLSKRRSDLRLVFDIQGLSPLHDLARVQRQLQLICGRPVRRKRFFEAIDT